MREIRKKPSAAYVTRFLAVALLFTVTAGVVAAITRQSDPGAVGAVSTVDEKAPVIVVDPGHGGEDPGASSDSGIEEKDVNLKLSVLCHTLLQAGGYDARLTRSDDRLLYDMYGDLDDYAGKKKTYDLRNRVRFAEDSDADLFVSIHLNKFFQPQYGGLQVYYSPNDDGSEAFASSVQNTVREYLCPENERQIKRATSSIYILSNIRRRAILVECGFLSNPKDLEDLARPEYDLDLAAAICSGIMNSFDTPKEPAT